MKVKRLKEEYEEIDLYDYLLVIWKWKWLIIIGVIAATLAAIPVSYLTRGYESQGVLRLSEGPKVTLPKYKIYSAAFKDSKIFLEYIKRQELLSGEEMADVRGLGAEFVPEDNIKPLYAYAEKEQRTLPSQDQFVSAVQIKWESSSVESAQKAVKAMGLFVRDTLEKKVMEEYVTQAYQCAYTQVQKLGSKLADLKFSLTQNEKKLADLQKIMQRSPRAGQSLNREVVSVEQGGHRYLPPSTQALATQVIITDIKLSISDTERQLNINRFKLELFTKLKNGLETEDTKSLFERLAGLKDEFFEGKDFRGDELFIVQNEVVADFAQFEHHFNDVIQFISGPTLPQRAKPSTRRVVAVAFTLGLVFFILLAFFLEFIQRNQQREKPTEKTKGKKN